MSDHCEFVYDSYTSPIYDYPPQESIEMYPHQQPSHSPQFYHHQLQNQRLINHPQMHQQQRFQQQQQMLTPQHIRQREHQHQHQQQLFREQQQQNMIRHQVAPRPFQPIPRPLRYPQLQPQQLPYRQNLTFQPRVIQNVMRLPLRDDHQFHYQPRIQHPQITIPNPHYYPPDQHVPPLVQAECKASPSSDSLSDDFNDFDLTDILRLTYGDDNSETNNRKRKSMMIPYAVSPPKKRRTRAELIAEKNARLKQQCKTLTIQCERLDVPEHLRIFGKHVLRGNLPNVGHMKLTPKNVDFNRIRNIGYLVTKKGLCYSCLTTNCKFKSYNEDTFREHLCRFHRIDESGSREGYCEMCKRNCCGFSIIDEITHIKTYHVGSIDHHPMHQILHSHIRRVKDKNSREYMDDLNNSLGDALANIDKSLLEAFSEDCESELMEKLPIEDDFEDDDYHPSSSEEVESDVEGEIAVASEKELTEESEASFTTEEEEEEEETEQFETAEERMTDNKSDDDDFNDLPNYILERIKHNGSSIDQDHEPDKSLLNESFSEAIDQLLSEDVPKKSNKRKKKKKNFACKRTSSSDLKIGKQYKVSSVNDLPPCKVVLTRCECKDEQPQHKVSLAPNENELKIIIKRNNSKDITVPDIPTPPSSEPTASEDSRDSLPSPPLKKVNRDEIKSHFNTAFNLKRKPIHEENENLVDEERNKENSGGDDEEQLVEMTDSNENSSTNQPEITSKLNTLEINQQNNQSNGLQFKKADDDEETSESITRAEDKNEAGLPKNKEDEDVSKSNTLTEHTEKSIVSDTSSSFNIEKIQKSSAPKDNDLITVRTTRKSSRLKSIEKIKDSNLPQNVNESNNNNELNDSIVSNDSEDIDPQKLASIVEETAKALSVKNENENVIEIQDFDDIIESERNDIIEINSDEIDNAEIIEIQSSQEEIVEKVPKMMKLISPKSSPSKKPVLRMKSLKLIKNTIKNYFQPSKPQNSVDKVNENTSDELPIEQSSTSINQPIIDESISNNDDDDEFADLADLFPWIDSSISSSVFKSKKSLKVLQTEQCQYATYKCMHKTCNFYTIDFEKFKSHAVQHEGDHHFCSFCLYDGNSYGDLCKHILKTHTYDRYQCSLCMYRACEKSYVDWHLKRLHQEKQGKILKSPVQKLMKSVRKNLEKKLEDENLKKYVHPYKCQTPGCKKLFYCKENFSAHLKAEGNNSFYDQHISIIYDQVKKLGQKRLFDFEEGFHECLYCEYGSDFIDEIQTHLTDLHAHELAFVCIRKQKTTTVDDQPLNLKETLEDFTSIEYIGENKSKVKLFTGDNDSLTNEQETIQIEIADKSSSSTSESVNLTTTTTQSSFPVISEVIHIDNA